MRLQFDSVEVLEDYLRLMENFGDGSGRLVLRGGTGGCRFPIENSLRCHSSISSSVGDIKRNLEEGDGSENGRRTLQHQHQQTSSPNNN